MTPKSRVAGPLVCILVLVAGMGFLWSWTLGFSAFTSYSYALKTAGPVPRTAPDVTLIDQFGGVRPLSSLRGRYVLLHAFYGSCGTICPIVIDQLRRVYSGLPPARRDKLVLVSITVDPARDTRDHLHDLWVEQGRIDGWIMARPADGSVGRFAREFGIWVFARKDGTINHSAYLFLIDPSGRIVHVIAPGPSGDAIRSALEDVT